MQYILNKIKPYKGECLTSYLARTAQANYIGFHELWRNIRREEVHYPQASLSASIDIYPYSLIEIEKLCQLCGLNQKQINNMVFKKVYDFFSICDETMKYTKLLSNCVEYKRNYCPKCLSEKEMFKLIWQVKDITCCIVHGLKLYQTCWQCKAEISLLPNGSLVGYCSKCNAMLAKGKTTETVISDKERAVYKDWQLILESENKPFKLIKGMDISQTVAMKLLFKCNNEINPMLLQKVRKSQSHQKNFSLSWLLDNLWKTGTSLAEFQNMKVPSEFIQKIVNSRRLSIEDYACMAPWCDSYNVFGVLERTSTSSRMKKTGEIDNFYMYCPVCSIEYCISNETKDIKERGYFIKLGWEGVRQGLKNSCSLKDLAYILSSSEDRIKRCIGFLVANNLVKASEVYLPIDIPIIENERIVNKFRDLVVEGININKIKEILNLTYNEFLYYRSLKEIRLLSIRTTKLKKKEKKGNNYLELVNKALQECMVNELSISIKKISDYTGLSPETMRRWGAFNEIKKYKNLQKNAENARLEKELKARVNSIVKEASLSGDGLNSESLYKALGYKRTAIYRKHPRLTEYIREILRKTRE